MCSQVDNIAVLPVAQGISFTVDPISEVLRAQASPSDDSQATYDSQISERKFEKSTEFLSKCFNGRVTISDHGPGLTVPSHSTS